MTISRRKLIQAAGVGAAALALPKKARAAKKTLRIVQWNHFVPGYDKWFNGEYIKEWGEKNDTEVVVDNIGIPAINPTAAAEVSAKKGHDLFMFLWPRPAYEQDVIDHKEIYQECEKKWGKPVDLAIKSTYNPKTKKYFGFSDMFVPDPVNWRKDLFDQVGAAMPESWDDVYKSGKLIKEKTGIAVGIGQAAEIDTAMAMRALLYSWGGSEQDAHGNIVLNSKHTIDAVKYMKSLYTDCMSPEVLSWDASSNNRAMLAGKASVVLNAVSVTREGENKKMPITDNIWLAKSLKGPARRMGTEHVMGNYVIWKFAENIDGAKKFLVDLVGNYSKAFDASEGYNFPCFTKTVPDLQQKLAHDSKAKPADKYAVLSDALDWATNVGYPGYSNAAIDEIYSTWVLNTMFAKASTGAMSPEDAVKEADAKCKAILQKWKERKLL
jgi:multiple sugar transport system substrate-binding protein